MTRRLMRLLAGWVVLGVCLPVIVIAGVVSGGGDAAAR